VNDTKEDMRLKWGMLVHNLLLSFFLLLQMIL